LVDVENAIIVDVEATTAIRQAEVLAVKRMIERSLERFDLYPSRLFGDSGYGSVEMLGWLVYEHGIEPHVTVFDKSARTDGIFSREDFKRDCDRCALKSQCCPKQASRRVPRSIYEGARDMARQIARSWEGRTSRRLRKKIEMLFAHLKRILKLDRLGLRGPNGARDEFILAATAQNPRRAVWALALSRPSVLPSVTGTTSAPRMRVLSRLNGWPMRSPVNASPIPSRVSAHDSGSMRFAAPSS
jgi:hypothetical protein